MKKRVISLLLCFCMLFSMQMIPAWAVEEQTDSAGEQVEETKQEQKEEASSDASEEKEEESIPSDEENKEEVSPPVQEEKEETAPTVEETEEPEEVPAPVLTQTTLPETKYLSDIDSYSAKVGWDEFQRDKNPDKGTISVFVEGQEGAQTFSKGIGAHAEATIIYDLGENHRYNYLSGYFSVNSTKAGNANARILVYTTNNTSSWGYPVFTSETLTGANAVPLTKIDITGYRYLKIYCDPLGHNGYDHTVVADAKVYAVENYEAPTYDVVFTKEDETNDRNTIATALGKQGATYASLLDSADTKKALMNRMFMIKLGSGSDDYIKNQQVFLTGTETEVAQKKALLTWLKTDTEAMEELLAGGDPEGCTFLESMNILSKLYAAHGEDIACTDALITNVRDDANRKKGDVYRTMMFAIALSGNVYAWLDTGSLQDPVERYGKFKVLYNHGTYQLRNDIFENLCLEEMRYVMNVRIWNDEITWLNAYVRENPKGQTSFPALYSPHRYLRYGKDWDNAKKGYLDEENYSTHAATYSLNTYGEDFTVPFSTKSKLWMVFAGSHICWGISYTGTNFAAAFGVPSKYVSQPGHGAWLIMNRGEDANSSTWGIDNNIYGWTSSSLVGWNLGNEHVRTMCGWGIPKNGWVGSNESSYILLSQYALNHEDDYTKAELLMSMDSYSGVDKEKLYNQVLDIMPYHLDAWYGLVKYYTANKSATEIAELAVRLGEDMKTFPLPMHDLMALLRNANAVKDDATALARVNNAEEKALLAGSNGAVLTGQQQSDVVKTMANYLRGNSAPTKIATFSFETGNLVVEDTFKGIRYRYSLDGGTTWSNAVETASNTSHSLTAEEINRISAEKDILIWLDGWATDDSNPDKDQAYCIDITSGSAVSGLTQNDNENRFFGDVSRIEYSIDEKETWNDLTDETRFEGAKTVYLRKKATGCTTQGTVSGPYTFTENNTATRSYIPLSRMTYVGCSSEETSRQNNAAQLAMDGLTSTIWHTLWDGSDKEKYIIFKTDKPTFFSGIDYTPRQDGGTNGNITACSVYASMDGTDWYLADSFSGLANDKTVKHLTFAHPSYGQYIKIVATGSVGNFASAAAIELFENTEYASKTVAGVKLTKAPTKTEYVVGEKPDISGATVTCVYTDGETFTVPTSMLRVSPSVLDAEGKQTVELTYMSYPAMTYEVTVSPNTLTPDKIEIETLPNKTQYYAGQALDLTGMVIKATSESTVWYPEEYTVSVGEDALTTATTSVTVTYGGKTADFAVSVSAAPKSLQITLDENTFKKEYNIGESLDTTGMTVTLTHQDNSTETLTSGYTVTVDDMALPGEKTMTVTLTDYPALTDSTTINVRTNLRYGDYEFEVLMAEEIATVTVDSGKYPCYLSCYTNANETKVAVPAEVTVNGVTYQVIGVRDNAFATATQVTDLTLPGTVQILESGSLTDLEQLDNLYLSGIQNINNLTIADASLPEHDGGTIYMASGDLSSALTSDLSDYKGLSEESPKMQTGSLIDKINGDKNASLKVTPPEQNTFELHESFSFSAEAILGDGLSIPLNASQYTTVGGTSAYGEQTVTVSMTGTNLTASFQINVAKTAPVIQKNPEDAMYMSNGATALPLEISVKGNAGDVFHYEWYYSTDSVFSTKDITEQTGETTTVTDKADEKLVNGDTEAGVFTISYTPTCSEGKENGYYYAIIYRKDTAGNYSDPVQSMAAHIQFAPTDTYPIIVKGTQEVYKTLSEALTHAPNGSTLVIRGDSLTMTSGVSFSQNSYTIEGEKGSSTVLKRGTGVTDTMFHLSGSASLTVQNLTIDGGAVWSGDTDAILNRGTTNSGITANDGVFKMSGTSSLTLESGLTVQNVCSTGYGGVVNINETGSVPTLTVDGATVQNCTATGGALAYVQSRGKLTIKSGTFSGNYASKYGGVLMTNSYTASPVDIASGTFQNNKAGEGGVVLIGGNSGLTISGGTFENNAANTNGGVVKMHNVGSLKVTGGTFKGNQAQYGGAFFTNTASLTGGTISGCKAIKEDSNLWDNGGRGGAVYVNSNGITVDGMTITGCFANGQGGGIWTGGASVTVKSGTIGTCSAQWGGGIFSDSGKVTMEGGTINACSAVCGGGIDVNTAPLEITGGEIRSCTSTEEGSGAAIHTGTTATVTIRGGTIYGSIKKGTISGGCFEVDPTNFLASGYACYMDETDNLYHVEKVDPTTSFSLSPAENFDMNFYLTPTKGTNAGDYTVTATFAGETKTIEQTNGKYLVAKVCPYQMTKPVTVTISYKGTECKTCSCSVKDYCTKTIAENSENTKLVNLCNAILQYGGDAQSYFNVKKCGEASYDVGDIYTVSNRVTPENPEVTNSVSGTLTDFSNFSTTLVLGSETSMKIYFTYTGTSEALSSYSFACDNGKTVTGPEPDSGNTYFVKITGITPLELSKTFTLSITKDSQSVQVHGSPYAFAASKWASDNDLLRQLCQSLVQYGTMAEEYVSE